MQEKVNTTEQETKAEKAKICLVDDLQDNLLFISSLLEEQGYAVACANNGAVALEKISEFLPDLVLLDITMPIFDGYEVCQRLKADSKTADIPVIFLSGLDEVIDKIKAFQVGGVDYLTKPFYIEELLVRIENQLTIQQQNRLLKQKIVEQQHVEVELERSRELLAGILNTSLDGVTAFAAIRDDRGAIIDFQWLAANPLAAMTVGKTTETLIGKSLRQDEANHLFDGLFPSFVQVVEHCTVLEKEYEYQDTWFQIAAVKLSDGFAMTFRDITERKRMEIDLARINQELNRQANMDSLTQIANRRCFDRYLTLEWARCAREKQPLSLILCDLDYFKIYNDTYGHQAGDECLTQVAKAMSQVIKRPADLIVRYGGEEFAAILPNTNGNGALQVAETIRETVKNLRISHAMSEVSEWVTFSLGVSSMIPNPQMSRDYLVASADRALYEAKEQGRDRSILATVDRLLY
jgi:two-component system, cell cycle response regulator